MISNIMQNMIEHSGGSLRDINHFIMVWSYAKTIGELEHLDAETQRILEVSAIVHDIACPLLRTQYGTCNPKLQESEGMPMARSFLDKTELSDSEIERIVYLVGHHHTLNNINGMDYQILIEADYIVNSIESSYSTNNILGAYNSIFRTGSGKKLLSDIYNLNVSS